MPEPNDFPKHPLSEIGIPYLPHHHNFVRQGFPNSKSITRLICKHAPSKEHQQKAKRTLHHPAPAETVTPSSSATPKYDLRTCLVNTTCLFSPTLCKFDVVETGWAEWDCLATEPFQAGVPTILSPTLKGVTNLKYGLFEASFGEMQLHARLVSLLYATTS